MKKARRVKFEDIRNGKTFWISQMGICRQIVVKSRPYKEDGMWWFMTNEGERSLADSGVWSGKGDYSPSYKNINNALFTNEGAARRWAKLSKPSVVAHHNITRLFWNDMWDDCYED